MTCATTSDPPAFSMSNVVAAALKHAVVVGGGWGGFGAACALLKAGVKVTILDASETPGGLSSGWRTPGGRSVEAGIKGYDSAVHASHHYFL